MSAIQLHIEQTQQHITNLDKVFQLLGQQSKGVTCNAAQGLVTEAQKTMGEAGNNGSATVSSTARWPRSSTTRSPAIVA